MLVIIPCVYVFSFCYAGYKLYQHQPQYILQFFIFGLPIYITALSLLNKFGLGNLLPVFQGFKELIVIGTLLFLIFQNATIAKLTIIDKLVLAYFIYTALYLFLPLGDYGFSQKLLALKSLSFFPLIYFTGRLINPNLINLNTSFSLILIVSILAGIVLLGEAITSTHLQTFTGYTEFLRSNFGIEPSGNFNLSWTFETANGLKRFASFYGMPLELGVNTIFALAALLALYTNDYFSFQLNKLGAIALLVSLLSIFLAISRASLVSYFFIVYVYALITHKKLWLKLFYYGIGILTILVLFYLKGDISEIIISTIDFSDESSAFHLVQWLEGLETILTKPFGLGLGMSGRVSSVVGDNIGGENQLVIIGVQAGFIAILLYLAIYIQTIRLCLKQFKQNTGKVKKLALCLLLVKIGMIIPTFTANTEAYVYIAYITWFFTGMVNSMEYPNYSTNQKIVEHA
ncbi:MAG: hypothetical protein CFE25_01705 [Chitinophagaceae bacterium BSSC1]|nr:MAG: hypothetical protein CFE25_01705 [Chitinophagaceae bacterium BSSC1]